MPLDPCPEPQGAMATWVAGASVPQKSWHGTNLRGSIRGLSIEQACWKPDSNRHSIWEHVLHSAYWKYSIADASTTSPKAVFPYKGNNWFTIADLDPAHWKRDIKLLESMQC